jgi:hypothetical protein
MADRQERVNDELQRTLGEPALVTDPVDDITRQTWTVEVPMDELERICRESNARMGYVVDTSEGGESD